MNDLAILPASLRDLRAVHALEKVCFGADAWGYTDLLFMFTALSTVRLKAVASGNHATHPQGELVGFIAGDPRPSESLAWIATVGVHPDYRRQGIGARLVAECEARLTEPRVRLTVRASNTGAIALYQREGYQQIDLWEKYYAGRENGLVMEKTK